MLNGKMKNQKVYLKTTSLKTEKYVGKPPIIFRKPTSDLIFYLCF